jgi:hypothetical protein
VLVRQFPRRGDELRTHGVVPFLPAVDHSSPQFSISD